MKVVRKKLRGKILLHLLKPLIGTLFSSMFAVEQAHMLPARPPHPGEPSRLFLFKMLNFKDWDAILYQAEPKAKP